MASQAGLNDQEFYKLVDGFEAIDVWRDIYEPQFGALKQLEHRSGKDDQGDVLAKFEKGEFVVEHTMIEPGHVMHADKILRADERDRARKGVKLNQCINVPAVSKKLRGKEEITKFLYAINPELEKVDDALLMTFDLVFAAAKKKLIKHSKGGLLVFGTKRVVANQFFIFAIRGAMKAIESVPNWRAIARNESSIHLSTASMGDGGRLDARNP